jgi:peptidoglycan/LPS O-acetylase OafA/YrhL
LDISTNAVTAADWKKAESAGTETILQTVPEAGAERPSRSSRVQSVDSLRGLAAFGVMLYHFVYCASLFPEDERFSSWIKEFTLQGRLGVPVFFVISGFVLPHSLTAAGYRWRNFRTFVAKRLVRLEPTYLLSLAMHLGLWALASRLPSFRGEPLDIEPARLFSHVGYLSGILGYSWYLDNYWTLGIELQFYLAMALAMPLLIGPCPWWRWAAVIGLVGANLTATSPALFFRYGALFALGIETFFLRLPSRRTRIDAVLTVAAVGVLGWSDGWATAIAAAGTAAIIGFDALPVWRPILWLGSVSYSLYLFHTIVGQRVLHIGERFATNDLSRVAVLMAAIVASLVASWLVCFFVEWPSQRLASRIRYQNTPSSGGH